MKTFFPHNETVWQFPSFISLIQWKHCIVVCNHLTQSQDLSNKSICQRQELPVFLVASVKHMSDCKCPGVGACSVGVQTWWVHGCRNQTPRRATISPGRSCLRLLGNWLVCEVAGGRLPSDVFGWVAEPVGRNKKYKILHCTEDMFWEPKTLTSWILSHIFSFKYAFPHKLL